MCACPFLLCCQSLYHIQTESPSPSFSSFPPLPFSLIPLTFVRAVLQSSLVPRVHQNSHQADYALSFNLSVLSVRVDHTARTLTNPLLFAALSLTQTICTLLHKTLGAILAMKTQKVTRLIFFYRYPLNSGCYKCIIFLVDVYVEARSILIKFSSGSC